MSQTQQSTNSKTGSERRAYPRYETSLDAQLISSGKGTCAAIVRDYCIGGMYLELISSELLGDKASLCNFNIGDVFNIVTNIEANQVPKQLNFNCKVMRVEPNYIGVSFVNPDLSIVQSLHKYVATHKKQADGGDFGSQTVFNGKTSAQILTEAHKLVATKLKPLMNKFHESISDHFFEAAKETFDMAKQNALFESLGVLEKNKNQITDNFTQAYKNIIQSYSPTDVLHEEEEEKSDFSLESLALVETDELDNWLSMSSIINNIDMDNRDELSKIEKRTSVLYRAKIHKKNNPFGPATFAKSFQDAIETIDIKHAVKLVCYTAFRDVYVSIAKDLYSELNKFFVENDVLPEIKFTVEKSRAGSVSGHSGDTAEAEQQAEEEVEDIHDSQPGGGNLQGNQPAGMTGQGVRSPGQAGRHQTQIQQSPAGNAPMPGAPASVPGMSQTQGREFVSSMHSMQPAKPSSPTGGNNLMGVFSGIRDLQQNIQQVNEGASSDQLTGNYDIPVSSGVPAQTFSASDVLNALSSQQLTGYEYSEQAESGQVDFKDKIQNILSSQSGNSDKVLAPEQVQVIDVASNVFSSLMNDFNVAETIRPWIRQLEVPVLKMAIVDNTVFTKPEHPVRSVIDRISELEVLSDSDSEEEQAAVRRAFDWLVKVINEEFDGTIEVFKRVAQQLDILIKIQNKTFDKNLKTVIDEVINEEKETGAEEEEVVIDTEDDWSRKVSRLEEGDWVLFDAFSEKPNRLKVGWIAKHGGKFVFVNVLGKKEKVLKFDELVELFKEGETIALDSMEESAMDRAQYSMLQKLHNQLLFQSAHDQLTGLINRREFEACVEKAIDDAKISNQKHALCYVDLDKFNVINNNCGYEGGDALIKEIAAILQKHMTDNSALSRISGDEFCMLLCGNGTDEALEVIETILAELNDYRFVWEDKRLSVAMSAGIVVIKGHGQTVSALMQAAESSCNVAKEIGGHRAQVYHEGHVRLGKHDAEMKWAAKIDRALDEGELHLRCQRIMPLASDDSYHDHYEILLGMTDEFSEQSTLQEFITAAENYKRMADIDRWVIKNSFKWIAEHRSELDHVSSFSINLSGHSLNDLGLMEFVMKQMRDTNVPIGKICFEITETLGIASLSDASDFIKRFKTTGCKFSLDDFGSGMSSYGYLKSLPVDYLKIDGVFVKDMATNPNDYAVVKSISEIGHFMGKKIIAEYVQDDETIELLKELGVDYAQGYGIEKPHPLDNILL